MPCFHTAQTEWAEAGFSQIHSNLAHFMWNRNFCTYQSCGNLLLFLELMSAPPNRCFKFQKMPRVQKRKEIAFIVFEVPPRMLRLDSGIE
ncbi:hypothetical protein PAXRUDRAFT_318223 [Paxillus rubicundulus Ve08.2h10]|uniref:Uncharacterized protein n=1 Tax=Paxillus rubicundulus Ve08.2h10 TaxID=930991 RepID=A0A0D0EA34_9AGAM|nr:hypothetical protein PAXRUDRAFT_318223 [Paxillus rubicundulus Ve08.2h10]